MARVTVEDCVTKIPNRFKLVMLAGKRAKDIAAGAELLVDRDNDKNPVVALREISEDKVAPPKDVQGLVDKLHTQKGILITQKTLEGANHFFTDQTETLMAECEDYLDARLRGELVPETVKRLK